MTRVIDTFTADFKKLWARKNVAERFLLSSWLMIIALIPFHALLSTWGGSTIGPLEVWKSWKEILILLCLMVSFGLLWHRRQLAAYFRNPLHLLIFGYAGLHLLLWAVLRPETSPALAGLLINLRFLGMVLLASVLLMFVGRAQLLRITLLAVIVGILGVIGFGLLQITVLPHDFLRHFGYGPATIAPFVTLDANDNIIRIQSTLRGPNPLGQYLLLAGLFFAAMWRNTRLFAVGGLLACAMLLFLTHSRSAWLGAIIAALALGWLTIQSEQLRRKLALSAAIVGAVGIGLLWWILPQSPMVQNVVLHNKVGDSDAGSTAIHWLAAGESMQRISEHPLGRGPGTAGPASFYGTWPQVPENYYLQIAEEVGLLGIAIFAAINVLVVRRLWQQRRNKWAVVLLASFAGMTVVNLLLHGWADDTMAIIWWSLAALFVSSNME